MKSSPRLNSTPPQSLCALWLRRLPLLFALAALLPPLSGCLGTRTHSVRRTVLADHVLDATLNQLVVRIAAHNSAIQSLNASVDISATTGGARQGEVKEIPTFAGYLFLRKPADLHLLMLLPVVRSRALEMVSDGKTFKLLIPPKNKAYEGADVAMNQSKSGLESMRPSIIRDALLVPPVEPDEYVTLTGNSRILPPIPGRKESIEEPDYDLTVSRIRVGHELETIRVIHISRVTLQPYQQDIYDPAGRIVTTTTYDKFQKSGDIVFPMSILISRPLDEYTLKLDFTKLTLNGKLDDEQFVLRIPESIPVQKM